MSSVIDKICKDLQDREATGINKYGTDLDRQDLSQADWKQHLYEELLDAACYLQKLNTDSIEARLDNVHQDAAYKFGKPAVARKLVEEMAELSAVIMQWTNKTMTYNEELAKHDQMAEELADVFIVAYQLRHLLGREMVDQWISIKRDRLKGRI